jgi:hypothetical protein
MFKLDVSTCCWYCEQALHTRAVLVFFRQVWNAVVEELRAVDVVNDGERDNLVFVHLDIDPSIEILDGMR